MISFDEAIIQMKEYDCPAMLYEEGGIRFSELNTQEKKSFALFVGSEGGFDESEAEAAREASMLAKMSHRKISRLSMKMVS